MEEYTGAATPSQARAAPEADAAPEIPPTGERRVDEALRRLSELDDLPVSEHPGVFETIHGQLVDVLGELRSGATGDRKTAG